MTAVAIASARPRIPEDRERQILARIDRGGLHICEAELRRTLRWEERRHGSLLQLLDEIERRGLIESAIHFRLTEHGRAQSPRRLPATAAIRHRDPLEGAAMTAGEAHVRPSMLAALVAALERGDAGRPAEITRRLGPEWTENGVLAALAELSCDGVVGHDHGLGLWWVA